MVSALTIALCLLHIAQENGDLITNLKLQKLLYYAQAWFMVNNKGEKLFIDDIQAWKYGPVVVSVYNKFRSFNSYPIYVSKYLKKQKENIDKNRDEFLKEFAIRFFSYSATELVAMTHSEAPWVNAYAKGQNTVIDTKEMYLFYKNMLESNEEQD
ncbi:Panacea domain-containing protein [Treponema sp.]|uniref:Panacea domain-containing protein n=1 Tax=Treponema sp. TaxID=166 RepID=UPI003F042CCB